MSNKISKEKKFLALRYFLALAVLFSAVLISFSLNSANASAAGCCVSVYGCLSGSDVSQADCETDTYAPSYFSQDSCSAISDCQNVYCCDVTSSDAPISETLYACLESDNPPSTIHVPITGVDLATATTLCTDLQAKQQNNALLCEVNSQSPVSAECLCGSELISSGYCCSTPSGDSPSQTSCPSSSALCGNNITEPGEECDDGNTQNGDGCSSTCQIESPSALCGNGIIDQGEECDGDSSAQQFCNPDLGTILGCSNACTCEYDQTCGNGLVEGYEQCDAVYDSSGTIIGDGTDTACPGACLPPGTPAECLCSTPVDCSTGVCDLAYCPDNCNQQSCSEQDVTDAKIDKIDPVYLSPEFKITYSLYDSCSDYLSSVILERWIGTDNDTDSQKQNRRFFNIKNINPYRDSANIEPNTDYCYQIHANYNGIYGNFVKDSNIKCITSGDKQCLDGNAHACRKGSPDNPDSRADCNPENKVILEECNSDETCLGPFDDGTVKCAYQTECQRCNSLFQQFSQFGTIKYGDITNKNCMDLYLDPSKSFACYLDYTKTPIKKFKECSRVTSCYSYKSEEACNTNRCGMPDCEWHSFNLELGRGICKPQDKLEEDCSLCNSPEFKDVLGDCTEETCKLFGSCYYNELQNSGFIMDEPNRCINERDTACEIYDTEEDCINSNSPYSLSASEQLDSSFDMNLTYTPQVSGNNEILNYSDDYFARGKCKWNSELNYCYKDSDNNEELDSETYDLLKDFNSPLTQLFPPSKLGKNSRIPYTVYDEENHYDDFRGTLACLSYPDSYCYPREAGEQPDVQATSEYIEVKANSSGTFNLNVFSMDTAKNLEPVLSVPITIDGTPPSITFTYDTETIDAPSGEKLSNVHILFTTSEKARCSAKFLDAPYPNLPWIQSMVGTTFEVSYSYFRDGKYHYRINCEDAVGNSIEETHIVTINADDYISNPLPDKTLNTTEVELSIDTKYENANCRYDDKQKLYDNMANDFEETSPKHHTATISLPPNSKVYRFYTACSFPDRGFVKQGNPGDEIHFAIDLQPPVTWILDSDLDPIVPPISVGSHYIYMNCTDVPITHPTINKGYNWEYGCKSTQYSRDELDWILYEGMGIHINTKNNQGDLLDFWYYSEDKGNNKENIRHDLTYRDTEPPSIELDVRGVY